MQKHKVGCPQLYDKQDDCMCDFIKPKPRARKPYQVVRMHDPRVNHGIRQDFVVRLWCDGSGRIEVKEKGRRITYQTTVGELYERLLKQNASR